MASGAAHRAGTGSSHANPIAILSSPSTASDVEDEYPDIDGIVPIDLTNTERLPSPIQRSLDHLNDRRDHEEHQYSDWSGIDSEGEDEAPGAGIPKPPEGFQSATVIELQAAVWAKDHGFAVTRKNGGNKESRGEKKGEYTRYEIVCDRAGKPISESTGLRSTTSRKCDCKWKGYAIQSEGVWVYRNYFDQVLHNHRPSTHPSAHPQHRKRGPEVINTITKASYHPGIRAREVGSIVEDNHAKTVMTDKDIYNERAKLRRNGLGGRSATGALIALLKENKIPHRAKWEDDCEENLLRLVFTFPELMELTARFWEVTSADITYRTNIFNYPLL